MEIELEQKELTSELGVGSTKLNPLRDIRSAQKIAGVAVNNADQSVSDSSSTVVDLQTFTTSVDGLTGTSRFIAKVAGYYQINASVRFADGATGYRAISIVVNNSTLIAQAVELGYSLGQDHFMNVSQIAKLAANDYIQMKFYQNSGGSKSIYQTGTRLSFSLVS